MQRSRSFSRPNTNRKARTPSPTLRGRTPPATRPASFHPDTRPLSRSRPRAKASSRSSSRSRSRVKISSSRPSSRSSSPSPARRSRNHRPENHRQGPSRSSRSQDRNHNHHHHHGLFKTSAGLLAGIGLATVLAHKVWPKGVLYGDAEEWESRQHSKHRHGHHSHHHHNRRSSDAERVIERAGRRRGEVVYYEEVGPFPRRRRSFGQSYERLSPRVTEERIRREEQVPRAGRLPYPDVAYPGDRFYEPERRRSTVVPPVAMPR